MCVNWHVLRSCFCEDCLFLPFLFIVTFSYKISNYNITRNSTPYYWEKNSQNIKVHCQRKQFRRKILVLSKMTLSLHTLPVEMIYRIFDNLNNKTILLSCYNVCTRLNQILYTYQRYQVIFGFTIKYISLLNFIKLFILYLPQRFTTLDLSGERIGPQGMEHLADALKHNKVT
jgi:hypothetical protein